jgi:vacuolar-type H+-ATPase subunit D/Vma8
MFVSVDREHELEILRRSIGMLQVGAPALDREKAMVLVRELQGLERQLRNLRGGLQRLLDEGASEPDVRG